MQTLLAATLAIALCATATSAQAGSYTGSWPVTATLPPHFGNTACLTLTDNGSAGSRHSGPVTSSGDMTGSLSGTFQLVNNLLVVNLQSGSDTGEVVFLSFIAPAHAGRIGTGLFNEPAYLAAAPLIFGKKGGC